MAKSTGVERVVLFGSRARGTNSERSDIDLIVSGGDFDAFYWKIQEEMPSLLRFDVVNQDAVRTEAFKQEIARDGLVIYEKT